MTDEQHEIAMQLEAVLGPVVHNALTEIIDFQGDDRQDLDAEVLYPLYSDMAARWGDRLNVDRLRALAAQSGAQAA